MSDTLYLVLDQGGQSSRALVFNRQGEKLAYARIERTESQHYQNQDPAQVIESVRKAATQALGQLSPQERALPIRAALISQRSSCLCWDRNSGQPLSPLLGWQDMSGQGVVDRLTEFHDEIHTITGLVPNGHAPAGKWSALLSAKAMQAAARNYNLCCGTLTSFLIFHLCREHPFLIDRVNAARTQLYSLEAHDWSTRLLSLFNVPRKYLPDIRPNGSRYGTLEIAGLRIPLKLVTGDQPAALFCNGWPTPGCTSVNMGTGAFIQTPLQVEVYERPRTPLLVSPALSDVDELLVLEGTVNGAATALNLVSLPVGLNYQESDDWRERYEPPPLFINGIGGLGSPDWCSIESGWQGIYPLEPKPKVLAVAESILFLIQRNLDAMREVALFPTRIELSGGLSQINWLAQGLANLSGLPVHRMTDYEASARGAAWLLCRSRSWQPLEETLFLPADHCSIHARYAAWSRLLRRAIRSAKRDTRGS